MSLSSRWYCLVFVFLSSGLSAPEDIGASQSLAGPKNEVPELHEYALRDYGGRITIDEKLTRYIDTVGGAIASASDPNRVYSFALINDLEADAWSLPGGMVAVTRGIMSLVRNEAELAMILAHELQHARSIYDDSLWTKSSTAQGIELRLSSLTTLAMDDAVSVIGRIRDLSYDRVELLMADRLGQNALAKAGYDPRAAITLNNRLLHEESSQYLRRHPPSEERILRLQENVGRIAYRLKIEGGELAEQRLSDAVSVLSNTQEAYDFAEKAKERVLWNAIAMIERAIKALPEGLYEAAFHSQKAALLVEDGRCEEALMELNIALSLDSERYQDYLMKGRCLQRLGRSSDALESYLESYRLLPNEASAFAIASLSKLRSDRKTAKRFYLKLMVLKGRFHERASREFSRLDILDSPRNYFLSSSTVRDGSFFSIISNLSGLDLQQVKVRLEVTVNGTELVKHIKIGPLIADSDIQVDPGWKVDSIDDLSSVSVGVVKVWLE